MPDSTFKKDSEDDLSSSQLLETDSSSISSINKQNNRSESNLHKTSMPNVMADFARRSGVSGSAFKAVAGWNKGTMEKALDAVKLSGVNQSTLKAIADWDKGTIAKALDVARLSRVNQSALKAIADWDKGTIAKALDVARLSRVNQSALKAIAGWDKGTMEKALDVARLSGVNQSALKAIVDLNQGAIAKVMAEAFRFPRLDESFFRVALEWSNSSLGKAMNEAVVMPHIDESFFRAAIDLGHSSTSATWEEDEQSNNRIVEMFKELSSLGQQYVMYLIITIIVGALVDYAKGYVLNEINLAVVYVIGNKPITKTDIISVNPEIKWDDLNHFRLITGENVRLRVNPSMKSEVIEVLNKNTAIAVLETKERQWLFVEVHLGDDKIQGWVNRSYTKRIGL
ncbi:TPA: SH3 domain-containing protein [Yersinia enterocolitica]